MASCKTCFKTRVEHPFGHIKHNLGVSAFLLIGIDGVKAEFSLLSTAFNLTRMITIVGGVKLLIDKIKIKLPVRQNDLSAIESALQIKKKYKGR